MTEPRFVEYPLDEFFKGKAMWAANFFVLWPLGLALTVNVAEFDPDNPDAPLVYGLDVRQWEFQHGQGETINLDAAENQKEYNRFLTFARSRLMGMTSDERHVALSRLNQYSIASAERLIVAD